MAVDAETLNDEDSSLMSQSWSEATVAQFDDCCVQIPVKDFMELIPGVDLDDKQKRLFKTFCGFDIKKLPDLSESKKLRPLCDIFNKVEELANSRYRWKVVANHCESADVSHKPDFARYPIDVPAAQQAYTRNIEKDDPCLARCAWAWMNGHIEVKNAEDKSPFFFARDRDTDGRQKFLRKDGIARQARGLFIKHTTEAMLRQHRTHYYSVYLAEMYARVFRWDRVGCTASEPIDLNRYARVFLNILYRLATSVDEGGLDRTVQLATEEEIALIQDYGPRDNVSLRDHRNLLLEDQPSYPIYRVACPTVSLDGSDTQGAENIYLIGRHSFNHFSLVGRCTRGYAAFDVQAKRFVWLKDQWRCVAQPHTELDAYVRLHAHDVPNIATPVAGGDIDGHRTLSQDYLAHLSDEARPSQRVHTRLITKEVGRPLETYRDSVELLQICTHAFLAHLRAYERAHILHGDVSIGNIMINCETGKGFLNDWDLCRYREDTTVKRAASEPSGTWAFKSALSLKYPRKPLELADDLEAFIYVITFLGLRFHHHELSPRPTDGSEDARITANFNNPALMGMVSVFFYHKRRVGDGYHEGGALKRTMARIGRPPVEFTALRNGRRSLIETFLLHAYKLLQEHYSSLDESALKEYAVPEARYTAPAGREVPTLKEALREPAVPGGSAFGEGSAAQQLWERGAADIEGDQDDAWEETAPVKPASPVEDSPPVLGNHGLLGLAFVSLFLDEHGNTVDVSGLRDDKRFDQFLDWKMLRYLKRKERADRSQDDPSDGDSVGSSSSDGPTPKRKRVLDDSEDDDGAAPTKRRAIARAAGPRTRTLRKTPAKKTAQKDLQQSTTRRRAMAQTTVPPAKQAPLQKAAKTQPRKAVNKPSETHARVKTQAAKSQPKKATIKASVSRKAQASRKPFNPRRSAAVKANVTGGSSSTKLKAPPPPVPARRSRRLASKP